MFVEGTAESTRLKGAFVFSFPARPVLEKVPQVCHVLSRLKRGHWAALETFVATHPQLVSVPRVRCESVGHILQVNYCLTILVLRQQLITNMNTKTCKRGLYSLVSIISPPRKRCAVAHFPDCPDSPIPLYVYMYMLYYTPLCQLLSTGEIN